MADRYIEVDGIAVPELNLHKWGEWLKTADRVVKYTVIGDGGVCTLLLGLDLSSSSEGLPEIYETMVFEGKHNGDMDRYATRKEAEAGHEAMVDKVTKTNHP